MHYAVRTRVSLYNHRPALTIQIIYAEENGRAVTVFGEESIVENKVTSVYMGRHNDRTFVEGNGNMNKHVGRTEER